MDKALQWPQVKPEDAKGLNAYAMFLVGCRNTMEDIELLEEMDNPTNLQTVVSKLLYKLKERWRIEAYNIRERRNQRARFTDLVSYIEHQAKVVTDPLFCDIPDTRTTNVVKNERERNQAKKEKMWELRCERYPRQKQKDPARSQQDKNSYVILDLEICGLEESCQRRIPTVIYLLTQRTYPSRSGMLVQQYNTDFPEHNNDDKD